MVKLIAFPSFRTLSPAKVCEQSHVHSPTRIQYTSKDFAISGEFISLTTTTKVGRVHYRDYFTDANLATFEASSPAKRCLQILEMVWWSLNDLHLRIRP